MDYINQMFLDFGINKEVSKYLAGIALILFFVFISIVAAAITKNIVLRIISRIIKSNIYKWDDIMLEKKVFHRLAHFVPAVIIYSGAPMFGSWEELIKRIAATYMLIVAVTVVNSLLNAVDEIYRFYPISKVRPIKGFLQVIKIVVYIIIGIIVIANLMGESPIILLGGIGALTAVFSLIFKDSILGLVAGIQLASNDMLRIGDWIEMPKYGADGDIIDITLTTVKVQNFDKTIVTVPAYSLISDSFKNWRGMKDSGGRRIKRSVYIDVASISFLSAEAIEHLKKIKLLTEYLSKKEEEIEQHNRRQGAYSESFVNGRHLTNIGTFRAYIYEYLKNHPDIRKDMSIMVRQLPPADSGIPLEVYAFANTTKWEEFEGIQADIFDHILAVADEFGIRIFQKPTGHDIRQIGIKGGY